jgi:gas vesicle protein
MLRTIRRAIKYFTFGLLAGVLLAPRKGDETRKLLIARGREIAQGAVDISR